MAFCEYCGAQLSDGALVCSVCGRGTQPQEVPTGSAPAQPQAAPSWGAQVPPPMAAPYPPKASKPSGNGSGRILFLLLGVALAGVAVAVLLAAGVLQFRSGAEPTAVKVEGPGYTSAEEAARAYAEALKAGDLNAMLSTFAVESYVEHFDMAAYIEDVTHI